MAGREARFFERTEEEASAGIFRKHAKIGAYDAYW
jgi:hypothetical protein